MFRSIAILSLTYFSIGNIFSVAAEPEAKPAAKSFCIVGYLPEYRIQDYDPAQAAKLTDLIFFSIETKENGELDTRRVTPQALKKLQDIKSQHKIRILVAVGGWDRSKGFVPMAANEKTRKQFVKNIVEYCTENKFDGVDLDWEHPANKAEEESYANLLADMKEAFKPKNLLLTVALADWQNPGPNAYEAVDRIHVMAYDHPEKHSTFEHAKGDVETFLKRKVPPEKICLGVPFYGRKIKEKNVEDSYSGIMKNFNPAPDADEAGGFYFNGIKTIQRKTQYAKEAGLAGIMVWELGHDTKDRTSLLAAIHEVASK